MPSEKWIDVIIGSVVWCSSACVLWLLPGHVSASAKRPEVPASLLHGGIGSVPGQGCRALGNKGSRSRLIK